MAWQHKKQIFKASFATSQFPSANPALHSTCTPAEQQSTTSPARGRFITSFQGGQDDRFSLDSEAAILWAWGTQAVPVSEAHRFSLRKRFCALPAAEQVHCHLVALWNDSRQVKRQPNQQRPEMGLITLYLCWSRSSHTQDREQNAGNTIPAFPVSSS